MKKIALSLIAISSTLCGEIVSAGEMGPINVSSNQWTGFYLGANAGGWWTSSGTVNTVGTPTFAATGFPGTDTTIMSQALAANATNQFSMNTGGFIGGGQIGYNRQFSKKIVLGLDVNIDGLMQSKKFATTTKAPQITGVFGTGPYPATISVSKNIDYLGTVRGRLGTLLKPTLLIYGTGGLAYGRVTFNTSFAQSANLPVGALWPEFSVANKISKNRTGWTAGGGGEWMFRPKWSAIVEYLYYDLGTINTYSNLTQIYTTGVPFAAANMRSSTRFAASSVRVGVNYHFS